MKDRDVHRCQCGAWKPRRRECTVCPLILHEQTLREWHARRAVEAARAEADTIARRQAVLRGAA